MARIFAALLIVVFLAVSGFAATQEAKANFWQEFDITFWQTVPFAAFWGYIIGTQVTGGGAVNWNVVRDFTLAVSAGNAYLHARKATTQTRP